MMPITIITHIKDNEFDLLDLEVGHHHGIAITNPEKAAQLIPLCGEAFDVWLDDENQLHIYHLVDLAEINDLLYGEYNKV